MLRAFRYFRPFRIRLIPVILASVLEMIFNAQVPLSVKFMIDRGLTVHNERMMIAILGALAAGTLIVSVSSMWRDYLYAKIVGQLVASMRERMFVRLQQLSMDFYARSETGDLMSRFAGDAAALETGLGAGIAWGLQPFMDLVLAAVLVFFMEWRLATIGLLLCPVCVLGPRLLAKRATEASIARQQRESAVMTSVQETLRAPNIVRAFNLQELFIGRFRETNAGLYRAGVRLGFLSALMERSATLGTLLLQAMVMGISGYFAFRGVISIGTFAAFQALFVTLSYSFLYLAQYTPNLISATGGLARIEELLKENPTVQDAPDAVELLPPRDAIELERVRFSYTGEVQNVDNVSLRIERGSFVALVGASGSGKSTVLNLIQRFYDPDEGRVLVDGTDLKAARLPSLRNFTAIVFQEGFLFNTTVRENIALARPGATRDEIVEAARAAEIHEFIMSLPEGYETFAGEGGSRFSGGQRQRIAIARAILRNPAILLLDEATSALDAATEHAINTTLERLAKGRTVISVTHRLSSVVNVDRIFLFDHGRLAEQGRHADMLRAGGIYAQMWQKQSGLHVDETAGRATVDAAWLSDIPLLKNIGLEVLRKMAGWFDSQCFERGEDIVEQGKAGNSFYLLVRGKVKVLRAEGVNTRELAKLQDGDYFGEMALLDDRPRNATVQAMTECLCLSLRRGLFERMLKDEPEVRKSIYAAAAERGAVRLFE